MRVEILTLNFSIEDGLKIVSKPWHVQTLNKNGLGFFTLIRFLLSMQKQWEWIYWLYTDQIKKAEETLHVCMSKEGSVVNNKFWTMSICNFRETLNNMTTRSKMIVVNHYENPKNIPNKWSRGDFFYKFLN